MAGGTTANMAADIVTNTKPAQRPSGRKEKEL